MAGNPELEEKHLIIAAMTDIKLAVKENEALLTLAVNLYHKGDIDRAYNYVKVALSDAIFYNSRFKNTVIARIHPIIENTYLIRLEKQKQNLRFYILLTSLFVVALAITLYFTYKQTKIVSRAKKNLKIMNEELVELNKNLDEANLIKERYVGYFMNQCAVYINKLDEYREECEPENKKRDRLMNFINHLPALSKKNWKDYMPISIKHSLNCILALLTSSTLC